MERPRRKYLPEFLVPEVPESIREEIPALYQEGESYLCVLGSDFQIGITGSGNTALEAMIDWDKAYQYLKRKDPELRSIWDSTRKEPYVNYWLGWKNSEKNN